MNHPVRHVNQLRYGCKVLLHDKPHVSSSNICIYYKSGLPFNLFSKYRQYFRYRTALFQVQNPRQYVEFVSFSYEHVPTAMQEYIQLKNKLTSAKAKATQYQNMIDKYRCSWNSLFPIEDDPSYKSALSNIETKKQHVIQMQSQLESLKNELQPKT